MTLVYHMEGCSQFILHFRCFLDFVGTYMNIGQLGVYVVFLTLSLFSLSLCFIVSVQRLQP